MEPITIIVCVLILCLLLLPCIPAASANRHPRAMRRLTTALVSAEFLLACALGWGHWARGGTPMTMCLVDFMPGLGVNFGILYDGATGLMLLLVSFVGFVVSRFSVRYLDGEATQGRYFRWLGFTLGAVSLMVLAGNLLLFFAAWVMTSLGLHQLLLHYRHRAAAHRAAWTKFAISRLGDVFLTAALVLTYRAFGTFDLAALFAQAHSLGSTDSLTVPHTAIAWLLMLGAVTKSAQFPFHVWLPDTMETPTPVSALMHAGIVNAGGYLVIRMSPLIALVPEAMWTLAVLGAFTACFGGVVMMTQPSVKRALAYSTIAQMGFMMLQCGLGAFAAAMLHIVAHSLYKAHAFLTSGSVVSQAQATAGAALPKAGRVVSATAFLAALIAAAAATTVAYFAVAWVLGVQLTAKPGGFVLPLVLSLAMTTWGWRLLTLGRRRTMLVAVAGMFGLCLAYVACYVVVDHLLQPTVEKGIVSPAAPWVTAGVAAAFCLLFAFHAVLRRSVQPTWLAPLRVHAVNGFYIDAYYQRVFAALQKS